VHAAADDSASGEALLADTRAVFAEKKVDKIFSDDLVAALVAIEGGPWAEMGRNRKSLTQNRLARMLRPMGVVPQTIRIGIDTGKGYHLARFKDAFERYLPCLPSVGVSEPSQRHNASGTGTSEHFQTVTPDADVTVEKCEKSHSHGHCDVVTVGKRGDGEERPFPLGRCAQCNGLAADAPLVTGEGYPADGVHLHAECCSFWLNRMASDSADLTQAVDGDIPPGTEAEL
jgi:hypothetical protein